jgi:aspartyl protease family protein
MLRSIFLMALIVALVSFAATSFLVRGFAQPGQGSMFNIASLSNLSSLFNISLRDLLPRPETAQPAGGSGTEPAGAGQLAIAPDRSGNFVTDVEIDGRFLHMIVDTGATYVSLSYMDAAAIGIRPTRADYTYRTMTANGTGVAAKVRIKQLRIGSVEIQNVEAFVMPPGVLGMSLLGMSALRQLGSVQISGGQLVLRQ